MCLLAYVVGLCIYELIDTLWNVNDDCSSRCCSHIIMELIDTLWNVNQNLTMPLPCLPVELIDTLWNVNAKYLNLFYRL